MCVREFFWIEYQVICFFNVLLVLFYINDNRPIHLESLKNLYPESKDTSYHERYYFSKTNNVAAGSHFSAAGSDINMSHASTMAIPLYKTTHLKPHLG